MQAAMTATHISPNHKDDLSTLQIQQRAAVEQYKQRLHDYEQDDSHIHPDLQDLSFGSLGNEEGKLPPPMRPTSRHTTTAELEWEQGRGSLSDFSDYESEEEGERRHALSVPSSSSRPAERTVDIEDPFADPFAD